MNRVKLHNLLTVIKMCDLAAASGIVAYIYDVGDLYAFVRVNWTLFRSQYALRTQRSIVRELHRQIRIDLDQLTFIDGGPYHTHIYSHVVDAMSDCALRKALLSCRCRACLEALFVRCERLHYRECQCEWIPSLTAQDFCTRCLAEYTNPYTRGSFSAWVNRRNDMHSMRDRWYSLLVDMSDRRHSSSIYSSYLYCERLNIRYTVRCLLYANRVDKLRVVYHYWLAYPPRIRFDAKKFIWDVMEEVLSIAPNFTTSFGHVKKSFSIAYSRENMREYFESIVAENVHVPIEYGMVLTCKLEEVGPIPTTQTVDSLLKNRDH